VRFAADSEGRTRPIELRCEPPLLLRDTRAGMMMVSGAGGPLGGDTWSLRVDVGASAGARMSSVAAMVAQPGVADAVSLFETRVRVEEHAALDWAPEPVVVVRHAQHRSRVDIELGDSSRLTWREVVVLGRHRQQPGRAQSRLRVTRGGLPLLAHDLDIGAGAPQGWNGPAVLDGARVVGSLLVVDPARDVQLSSSAIEGATVFTLAGPGVLVVARGQNTIEVTAALDAARAHLVKSVE
jgi:urease accessory protein